MEASQLTWITNFIWSIADDVLRDLYVRGKYRDVILPMTVIRRLDAVLEPNKKAVLDMKASLDKKGITNQEGPLCQEAGQAFYNASKFTLRDLKARASRQQLEADFLECQACHQPDYLPSPEDQRTAIETFLRREVLPYTPDLPAPCSSRQAGAWYDPVSVKVGYEISFNRYFYKPKTLCTLEEIRADLLAVEKEAEGLLAEIWGG